MLFLQTGSRVDLKISCSMESLTCVTLFMPIDDVTPFKSIDDFELIQPVLFKQLISKRVRISCVSPFRLQSRFVLWLLEFCWIDWPWNNPLFGSTLHTHHFWSFSFAHFSGSLLFQSREYPLHYFHCLCWFWCHVFRLLFSGFCFQHFVFREWFPRAEIKVCFT